MQNFNYFQPTEIRFGAGRLAEVGEVVANYGKKCLLVTVPTIPAFQKLFERTKVSLEAAGVEHAHWEGVIPNPTTESITEGAEMAKALGADVILGVGGGSSMDSAKAVAVEATHDGTAWDYLFYKEPPPDERTLPVIAVSTTSGTGSQGTQVAVITHTETRDKSAIYNSIVYPKVTIVDPELMLTVPEHITASTGFDAFCHAFESTIHPNASPYIDMMAAEVMRRVFKYLPGLVKDGSDLGARTQLAWADTLAGLCIANAGVTLPHGIGMAIGGMYPHVMHGEALALNYPTFTRFTQAHAVKQFAAMGRFLDSSLEGKSDEIAAEASCEALDGFLLDIGMWFGLADFDIPEGELDDLTKQSMVLPDYKGNPRVTTEDEMRELLASCFHR